MQRFFSLFVIAAIAIGGTAYLYMGHMEREARAEAEAKLKEARRSFAERVRGAVDEEDPQDYLRGVKAGLSSYEEELKSVVYKDHSDWFDVEAMRKQMDAELKEGNISEAQHKGMMDRFSLVKAAYDTLMNGSWKPELTQVGKGETRMDIFDVRRIHDRDGKPVLEARFFLWGVEPNTRIDFGNLVLEYWTEEEPDAKMKRQRRKEGRDPDAPMYVPLGRAEGDASPVVMDANPAKTIPQFPSYVAVGTLWFPQVPQEAKVMDLKYAYSVRKGGGSYDSELVWDKMPIPSKWRLGEGEAWMADEVEATEDELKGYDPNAPDAGQP